MFACISASAYAQTDTIRYVHPNGVYNNDGKSWATAFNRVQDAINSLRDYLAQHDLHSGSVYIAAGNYIPTESTESSGGSILNTSFKIYGGIHVYGGFNPDSPEEKPGDRIMANGKKCSENWANQSGIGTVSGDSIASQWDFRYKTVLSGNHSTAPPTFTFDSIRGKFNTAFPANSFHVVWFATNGKFDASDDLLKDHYRPLTYPASLDGCVISSGNASSHNTNLREHTAYGGGVYMVGNSLLKNCIIERCSATMRGGGVYVDGGGDIDFCYIHTCQAVGVGVYQGYGGGVCIDHEGSIGHSHIQSCAARCGGGLVISHEPEEYPETGVPAIDTIANYSPFATACVINNNTANAEGGGIYLAEGGTINHCTVTGNECIGPDVTYYGRRHGRTGGIYVRNCGMIFNSVFWGNRCDVNNDIQFASVRQKTGIAGYETFVFHTAFMNHDITDWTGVRKEVVFSLDRNNLPVKDAAIYFPCFFQPTVDPLNWYRQVDSLNLYGAGVITEVRPVDLPGPRIWHLTTYSALDQKGVQANETVHDASPWLRHSHTDYGVVSNPFEPVSTLGALVRKPDALTYELIAPQGYERRVGGTPIPTLFIDPNRQGVYDEDGHFVEQPKEGDSWRVPIKDLGEAISFFRQYLVDDPGGSHHYMIPALDENGMPTGELTRYDYVQYLVKEGTLTTVGPGNYLDKNIRSAALRVDSHMRIYGGYPSYLEGTDTSERDPRKYKSIITANITGIEGEAGYQNNSAHVIAMVNVEHTIVDGFTLTGANTHNVYESNSVAAGGGLLLNNSTTPAEKRIHMVGNQLRNCVISNCTSPKGAAVYVNGEWSRSDGELCFAELMIQNCVIRNNTADYDIHDDVVEDHGIITANGRAYIHIEHCTVVNNVGFPFKADSKTTDGDLPIHCGHPEHSAYPPFHGYIRVDNSLIFCNGDRVLDNRGDLGEVAQVMSVNADGQDYVFGKWNMFDADLRLHKLADHHQPRGFFANDFEVPDTTHFMPNGVSSHFAADIFDVPADSLSRANRCVFTRVSTDSNYPTFVNPSRNVGHSPTGDKPLYGGVVAYAPLTTNPCVNAAHPDDYTEADNYDRSDNLPRDRGGAPDIGAIENSDLPAAGSVIYVTPEGAGKRDGSSWDNAIAGNTVYRLYNAPAADGDSVDIASNARLINQSTGEPVLTTDDRYCGGYARKYEYTMSMDVTRKTTTTMTRNIYVGGDSDHIDTISTGTPSTKTTMGKWYTDGIFYEGYDPSVAVNASYPYGEMSGVSRSLFRATDNFSPRDENNSAITTYDEKNAATVAASGQVIIRNERKENYVSGLQYAVEQASILNKTIHEDSVQVWVGAGKYTDYKGFVMRDSVRVLGGFPAGKFQAPGMNERRALMSDVVAIPKSRENRDLDPKDYESILQISDVNPRKSNTEINPEAIKFNDSGEANVKWQFTKTIYDTLTSFTDTYYRWEATGKTDVTATYVRYPDMLGGGSNVWGQRHKINKSGTTANFFVAGNEVFGGQEWTSGDHVVYAYFGPSWKDPALNNNQGWELVYQDLTGNVDFSSFKFDGNKDVLDAGGTKIGTVPRGMALSGCMLNMSAWQTMKQVPAGEYELEIDLGAYYVNAITVENTDITFEIEDAEGTIVVSRPVFCNGDKLRRYVFNFEQPVEGDLTIRVKSAPGSQEPSSWSNDANKRKVFMANVHLYAAGDPTAGEYVLDYTKTHDVSSGMSMKVSCTKDVNWQAITRTTIRKRVLQMPDVTNPVYGHGLGKPATRGNHSDALSHYERVIKESRKSNVKPDGGTVNGRHNDPNYKEYDNVTWDGFTIRHGFLYEQCMAHGGGAGVAMYEGAHLVNCIVTDNWAGAYCMKGGGVFCDGSTSTIENCFILNNTSTRGADKTQGSKEQQFAGGLFLYEGTCFNTLIANNYANGFGGGLGLCVGKFYNNTVAYNYGDCSNGKSNNKKVGGLRIASGAASSILFANSILYGNNGLAVDMTDNSDYAPFLNCYIQSADAITKGAITHAIKTTGSGNYGVGNTFHNGQAASAATTPFNADVNRSGVYTDSARIMNDFALRQVSGIHCVNSGTEDFAGTLEEALAKASFADAKNREYRAAVEGVELPANDVVYAKRVQDCQVDIGAYEFNAAYSIKPDTTTHPGHAIFYVAFDSPGGDASASSPEDAACHQKLQQVLDAAGRYKYTLMTSTFYNKGTEGVYAADQPNKHWTVEVWMQGDSAMSTESDSYSDSYTPTRSTKHSVPGYQDNTLDYSFIIPHGIQVKGGYKPGYFHYEKDGEEVPAGIDGAQIVDDRDPLTYRTVLSGFVTSSTGASGQTFHVVTFTNNLYDADEMLFTYIEGGDKKPYTNQLAVLTEEKDRAVLDGLFIENGYANSPDPEDQIGGGAVVPEYAHIRNCVVQDNQAMGYGGGLYLKPFALVSGTIIKRNSANTGGGIYVEKPASLNVDSLARIYISTICHNSATASAGGMWFDNTYARVNSSVLWHNSASDNANVSGLFTRSDANTEYPFNFCAVESRRLEGQGNVELSPSETEGVRWDRDDPFNAILYYPIEMSSTLARAGMTYTEWYKAMEKYPTLDSIDIAGVSRTKWNSDGSQRGFAWTTDTLVTKNNDMIEIGARAINKNYAINVDEKYVMRRLYVMHTDLINSEAARALQDNKLNNDTANMYRQMGSCILNPFHRPGDAFDYIIAARKSDPEKYRNMVFEVYIEAGTYYPYHNAYGEQDEVRNNTFLIPEGIYVIGGVDSRPEDHHYGQEGFFDMFTGVSYGSPDRDVNVRIELPNGDKTSYTINASSLDSIRLRDDRHRPMRDNNLNSVIEPWELERQTIFSGNAVSGEDFTHVYHVVTMHADSNYVGPQPRKYRRMNPYYNKANPVPGVPILIDPIPFDRPDLFHEECDLSILGRTTEFDGIQITGGYANRLDRQDTVRHHYVKKTYFRGGGILVDGNWTESFDAPDAVVPNVTEPAKYNIPIVVENCLFTNNMAGNGGGLYSNGGIYMYGCHFTQNYSQGPMTPLDQQFIPWTAGGCIATNDVCDVSNTLFDNNEARRGLYPITVSGDERIPNADARQGFGGVLSVAALSRMRVANCHFMKNKAVAYPSIYNFLANNHYINPDSMQYAFNSIFWGNEVFEVDNLGELEHVVPPSAETIEAFNTNYKGSRKGVFHYDPLIMDAYERTFHEYDSLYTLYAAAGDTFNVEVTDKLAELRALGDDIEGLYFCSYRKGYGPTAMKPSADGYLLTRAEQRAFVDPRKKDVKLRPKDDSYVEAYDNLFSYVHGNNNVLINHLNTATDGPNFKQPTYVAGIDGYMQNADWLFARMNHTTDQGWGHLTQTVERGISYYITKYTGTKRFDTQEEAWTFIQDTVGATTADVYSVRGLPVAQFDSTHLQPAVGAMYNFLSRRYGAFMSDINAPLPIMDQYYMSYTRSTSNEEVIGNMERISRNPKFGENDIYIDVGMYEYQYVQLDIRGQEIDTMWVATKAKDPIRHDGLTWETPTTDLQTAIDMLMASHNNHDKYICFMGDNEGTFSPQNVINNRRAFIITSNTLAPIMPDSAEADFDYGINSLNFLGGYSYDVKGAPRDPQAHPVIIEMPNAGTESQRNQLFVVEDMTRQLVQVNWQGEYTTRDSVVIPVSFDGITFINPYSTKGAVEEGLNNLGGLMSKKGGAAIYYRWQRRYEGEQGSYSPNFNQVLYPDSALVNGRKVALPKLTISNCIFMDNGARTPILQERSPAVRIDHGGGSSLIVNSLFHSNAGAAVYAKTYDKMEGANDLAKVPNDVVIVNSTFALNDGHIRLESENSEIHNSIIWLDDLAHDTLVQLQLDTTDQWDKTTNREKPGIAGRVTHNAIWGCFMQPAKDPYGNDSLVTSNNDIYGGPGFVMPIVTATTSEQRRERSFRLNPSLITINKADSAVYRNRVFFRQYPDETATEHYWRRSSGFKAYTIPSVVNDSDLASKPRYSGDGMDRGAYECLAQLQRVLYVQPDRPAFAAGDGSSWDRPFGQGQLQNAIDAAAVYTYMRTNNPSRETRKAYVFVKGSYGSQEHTHLVARDGVFVYGSLPSGFNDTVAINEDTKEFTNAECRRFVNYVRAAATGVASPNATPTRIHSVHIEGDEFHTGFLLDGFEISGHGMVSESPAIILDNELSAVRNCVILDKKSTNTAIAEVNRGLLYNCLFFNDSADVLVRVGANGLALNNTIVADSADITPMDVSEAREGAAQNNITINAELAGLNGFAPYLSDAAPHDLPAYMTDDKALAYQLHEHSPLINAGVSDAGLPAIFNTYKADSTILFNCDRDILGNPRVIGAAVDKGAFETWRIAPKTTQFLTAITNREGSGGVEAEKPRAFLNNYGGNVYPHAGSVVYIMDSAIMAMQYEETDFKNFNNDSIILRPGYVLLRSGASFYGNGHKVQFGYVAAEKRFKNQRYSMTAFPFRYTTADIAATSYDAEKDSFTYQLSAVRFDTYQYSGAARSVKDYVFKTDSSALWRPVDTLNRTANDGYLMDFGSVVDTVLRFTAFAPDQGHYVYTETGDDKSVFLTQYDHNTAGLGSDLDFTRQEDMGWNMKGLPWLVSNYRTDTILWAGNFMRQMYIPHVLYMMDGSANYPIDGDRVYTVRSWDRGATLSMGSAFLTQTATTSDREEVIFHLPLSDRNERIVRPLLELAPAPVVTHAPMREKSHISNGKSQISNDLLTFLPDPEADKSVQYTYGRDGVKWIASMETPQVYLMDSKRLSRISYLGAAPTDVDIPLGAYIPASQTTNKYLFRLPEKEAFVPYLNRLSSNSLTPSERAAEGVIWLIDYAYNRFINLMEEDYEVELNPGENNHRFAIRIGAFPKANKEGKRQYIVYASQGTLYVRGIIPGDHVAIHTVSGQLIKSFISSGYEFNMPVDDHIGYIVQVNDTAHKALNH